MITWVPSSQLEWDHLPLLQVILPKPLPTPLAQYGSLGGYTTVVGRQGFPGQRPSNQERPSKPRRIEPASNHTATNAANRNAANQAISSNSAATHPPAPRPNQPSATAGRSLQIISSSDVARSSNQGEVQTRPIEVICGPGGEASVRCEGTLSEVKTHFSSKFYLICLLTGGCTPDSKSTCQ